MAFDRLIYIDRLKQAGLDESTARAHADALRDALLETVATQADIKDLRNEVKAELLDIRGQIKDVRSEMQLLARDLTIRGAGGLVVLASLLIGLKFFG